MRDNLRLHIQQHLRQLMMEEVDYGDIQQQVYKKTPFGKLYKREIQLYMKALKEKFGIEPQRFLGAGDFGFAFLSTDNKTIKITSDKSEVVEAQKWKDKNPEHLPKIFNIIKVKVGNGHDDAYIIVKEFILHNPGFMNIVKGLEKQLSYYLNDYHMKQGVHVFPFFIEAFFDQLSNEQLSPEDINKFVSYLQKQENTKYLVWYVQQIYYLYEEMAQLGIESKDTYAKNMGIKNKRLIFLDPGYGDFDGRGWVEKQPYGLEVNEENTPLFEDDELHASINSKAIAKNEKKFSKWNLYKYLKVLRDKFGINAKEFIDVGSNGVALLDDKNRVIKITTDRSEAVEANKFAGKDVQHLPAVYKILKFHDSKKYSDGDIYVIVKEYILQNQSFVNILDEQMLKLKIIFNYHFVPDYLKKNGFSGVADYFNRFYSDIVNNSVEEQFIQAFRNYLVTVRSKNSDNPRYVHVFGDKKNLWLFNELVDLAKELQEFGINSVDFDASNFGLKNKRLIYLDVGFGDWYGSDGKEKGAYDASIDEIELPR